MIARLLKRKVVAQEPSVKEESKPSNTGIDPGADKMCTEFSEGSEKLVIKKLGHAGLDDEAPSPSGSDTTYGATPSRMTSLGDASWPVSSWNCSDMVNRNPSEQGNKSMGSITCPKIAEIAEDDDTDKTTEMPTSKEETKAVPSIGKEEEEKVCETATDDKVEDLMRAAGSVAATTAAAAAAANLVTQQRLGQKEVAQQSTVAGQADEELEQEQTFCHQPHRLPGVETQQHVQQRNTIEEKDAESPLFRAPPGLPEVVSLPSRGSGTHMTGECSPCVWHWKPQGCLRGRDCGYCHLCPEGEVKARKKLKVATLRSTSGRDLEAIQEKDQKELINGAEASNEAPATPAAEQQTLLSIGSNMHGTGECRPCAWFWKPQGCQNGADCRHCHLCHEGEIKARKKMKAESLKQEPSDGQIDAVQKEMQEQSEEGSTAAIPSPPGLAEPDQQATNGQFSVGSQKHGSGDCRPCAWFWKPQSCRNGADCGHCHLCPAGELKVRKKEKADTVRVERHEEQQAQEQACAEMMQFHQVCAAQAMSPFCLPMVPPPSLPSLGSALHGTGMCRPCAWFWKPQGCGNAMDCCHCHLCPEGEIKARRKMKVAVMRHHGPKDSPMMNPMTPMSPLGMFWDPKWQSPVHGDRFFMGQQEIDEDEDSEEGEEEEQEEEEQRQQEEEEKETKEAAENKKEGEEDKEEEEETAEEKPVERETVEQEAKTEIQAEPDAAAPELNGDQTPLFADMGMLSPFAFASIPPPMSLSIPPSVEVALPSTGSALHALGKCRPCAWMWKAKGCLNGEACAHCHLCPEGELKVRKKVKETAMRMGALVPSRNDLDARSPRFVKLAAGLEA